MKHLVKQLFGNLVTQFTLIAFYLMISAKSLIAWLFFKNDCVP